jgi:AcrR family transcriptional regulator
MAEHDPNSEAIGRREEAKKDKRERITIAARELFAAHGVNHVTTQQVQGSR